MKNKLNDRFLSRKTNRYFLKHIATIFVRLELNFSGKQRNSTKVPLAIDCLNDISRTSIFKIVANTLEYRILNLLEAQFTGLISSEKAFILLEEIISLSITKFFKKHISNDNCSFSVLDLGLDFSLCDLVVWNHVLNYFYTGNPENFRKQQSLVLSQDLLEEHIVAILDHFVIKLSNIAIAYTLNLENLSLSRSVLYFTCKPDYLAQRYLINFKNNLLLFKGLDFYVYNPKLIYENKFCLFVLESGVISLKNIYFDRHRELAILCRSQLIILLLLEIQDLILPKLKNFVYLLGKSLIYLLSYILSITIKMMTRKAL